TSRVYETQKWFAPTAQEPMKAKAAINSSGQTNSLRFCSLSDAQETTIIAIVAARYGTEESQPTSTMPIFALPLRMMDGSHRTNPYTPILQVKYCMHSRMTLRERNASL